MGTRSHIRPEKIKQKDVLCRSKQEQIGGQH